MEIYPYLRVSDSVDKFDREVKRSLGALEQRSRKLSTTSNSRKTDLQLQQLSWSFRLLHENGAL
jgi:hypothetical protein